LRRYRNSPQVANIANGIWLPIVMPKFEAYDLGAVLESYVEASRKSYSFETFESRNVGNPFFRDARKFESYAKGKLAGQVSVVENSRQDRLIWRMKRGPVIAIHFPNSLQGCWLNASREQWRLYRKVLYSLAWTLPSQW
jgi:hypothetical protein